MNTTLLIMAAGIGSRFGTGIKQLEPVDASNHIIMDYSIHDAIEAELVVVQEELQQKKQIAGNTEVLLTADNLQQYVKKIEVDHKKNTYTEFAF